MLQTLIKGPYIIDHTYLQGQRVLLRDWSLITGRAEKLEGGRAREVLPLQKGGEGGGGGGNGCSHAEGGGGAQKVLG